MILLIQEARYRNGVRSYFVYQDAETGKMYGEKQAARLIEKGKAIITDEQGRQLYKVP